MRAGCAQYPPNKDLHRASEEVEEEMLSDVFTSGVALESVSSDDCLCVLSAELVMKEISPLGLSGGEVVTSAPSVLLGDRQTHRERLRDIQLRASMLKAGLSADRRGGAEEER